MLSGSETAVMGTFKVPAKEIEEGREVEDLIRIILRQFALCHSLGTPLCGHCMSSIGFRDYFLSQFLLVWNLSVSPLVSPF